MANAKATVKSTGKKKKGSKSMCERFFPDHPIELHPHTLTEAKKSASSMGVKSGRKWRPGTVAYVCVLLFCVDGCSFTFSHSTHTQSPHDSEAGKKKGIRLHYYQQRKYAIG